MRLSIGQDRYTAGFSLEAYFNEHVSVDFNPLYRRSTSQGSASRQGGVLIGTNGTPVIQYLEESISNDNYAIQLPVIGKYTFGDPQRKWRPFLGAGFGFQTAWQTTRATSVVSPLRLDPDGTMPVSFSSTSYDSWATFDSGAVLSGGVRFSVSRFQFVPEFRYTRWGGANNTQGRNAPELLVAFRF